MKNNRVAIIAMDQPLDSDAQLRGKMVNVEKRSERQSSRFPELDLHRIQKEVNRNLLKLPLLFKGKYMGLPDLMNYIRNGRQFPLVTPENASHHYLFANGFSLNGVYLYQYLSNEGYDPRVIQNYSLAHLPDIINEKPLAICISSTFLYLDDIRSMAHEIKALDPSIPVIVGGILVKKIMDDGANLAPQTLKWLSGFADTVDAFVVETHGEQTLVKVLGALARGRDLGKIPNLGLFDEAGKIFFTPRQEEGFQIDTTAIAWDRIPKSYLRNTLSVMTSQGCHYRCRFCTYHRWFPKVLYKSLDTLKDELRRVRDLGFVRHLRFADDNFTANAGRLKTVMEMMIRENFDFTWSAFARASAVTPEVVRLMKASGCAFINMGLESGSPDILKNMDKRLDPGRAMGAVHLLEEQGIATLGGVIVGYPGETRDTFEETMDFIQKSGLTYYHPYLFYYSKSMLVHKERDRFGLKGVGWTWRHDTMDSMEASRLMAGMIPRLDRSFTDGQQKTWETFKLLMGEGYSPAEIYDLHRLKRDLQVALDHPVPADGARETEKILTKLEILVKKP